MGSLTVLKNETRGMIGKSVLFDADSISKKGGVWIKFVVLAVFFSTLLFVSISFDTAKAMTTDLQ